MVKDHSDRKRGNSLPPHNYSFWLAARVNLYRQDLCYTSRGTLAGTRNSSMGSLHEGSIRRTIAPWANALTTDLHLAPGECLRGLRAALRRFLTVWTENRLLVFSWFLSPDSMVKGLHLNNWYYKAFRPLVPKCKCVGEGGTSYKSTSVILHSLQTIFNHLYSVGS